MTFVPTTKLVELNAVYRDRIATSLPSMAGVSAGRPTTVTTRFEAFSCKKISLSRAAQAAPLPPSSALGGINNTFVDLIESNDSSSNNNNMLNSSYDEDEQALLHSTGCCWNKESNNSSSIQQQQQQLHGGGGGGRKSGGGDDLLSVESHSDNARLVPLVSAVMDAMYERDGFSFQGVVEAEHVELMEPAKWFDEVCNVTTKTVSSAMLGGVLLGGASSGGGLSGGSGGGGGSSGGNGGTISSSSTVMSSLLLGGASPMGITPGLATTSGLAASASADIANEGRKLWRAISDSLNGAADTMDATNTWPPREIAALSAAAAVVASAAPGGNSDKSSSNSDGNSSNSKNNTKALPSSQLSLSELELGGSPPSKRATSDKKSTTAAAAASDSAGGSPGAPAHSSSSSASTATPVPQQTPLLSLSTPGLQFFRFNAPDLDPQRKNDGSGLRSGLATPNMATPIASYGSLHSNNNNHNSSAGTIYSRKQASGNLPFPDTPQQGGGGGGGALSAGSRRQRADDSSGVESSVPSSPTSFYESGAGGSFYVSEHYFVFYKKTKMCLAVVVAGR